jgi:SAM-dependent methyltransferase
MDSEPRIGDAFGEMLRRLVSSPGVAEIVERDDGFIDANPGARYFAERTSWPELDVAAVERCTGRVLDVGVGAGRAALNLQADGLQVVGLDTSPGAVAVSAARGVRETFVGTVYELAAARPEPFDTILLLGNNLGLLEGRTAAPRFLAALAALAAPGGRIVGTGTDPYGTDDPGHLRYHERNRSRDRMAGQLRLRVRHRHLATPWFDYLLASLAELEQLTRNTGWGLEGVRRDGAAYVAVLARR